MIARIALVLGLAGLAACGKDPPKLTMTPQEVVTAIEDFMARGCVCETDKECFRAVRDEWDAQKQEIVRNARLLTGDDKAAYDAARTKFGQCGDGAGLAVFDKW